MPPEPVHDVLEAVLIIFGNFESSWNNMKKFLGQKGVIESILAFDPHNITPEIRKDVSKILKEHANSFEKQVIYYSSQAAGPLADWVQAILQFSEVLIKIKPLEDELSIVNQKIEAQRKRLKECEEQLLILDKKVNELQDDFARKTSAAEILKKELNSAIETLKTAETLLEKLGGERTRWQDQLKVIDDQFKSLYLDSLMAAGIIPLYL